MKNFNTNSTTSTIKSQNYVISSETPNNKTMYIVSKRCFDLFFAFVFLILLSPLLLVISLIIKIDSRGTVLFSQERLGKDGKEFLIYKFRTMKKDAEKDGPQWAIPNDQRCTKVGKILRKSHLDELPQLINILKGEMSFVGPRPERSCFYEEFETYIKGFKNRLAVTPGLTGLAQVKGGYVLKPEEKIVFDMEYIKTQSLWVDIKIIFNTVTVVFKQNGAY